MSEIIKRYIVNIPEYAMELHTSIKENYIPSNHPISNKVLLKEMEKLLIHLVQSHIRANTNSIVPNYDIDEEYSYQQYGLNTSTAGNILNEILIDYPLLDKLMDDVDVIIKDKPWNLFVVRRGIIEDFGDWRILEWEKEHLTEDGKYVHSKSTN